MVGRAGPPGPGFQVWADLVNEGSGARRGGPRFTDPADAAAAQRLIDDPRTNDQLAADTFMDLIRLAIDAEPGTEAHGKARQHPLRDLSKPSQLTTNGHGLESRRLDKSCGKVSSSMTAMKQPITLLVLTLALPITALAQSATPAASPSVWGQLFFEVAPMNINGLKWFVSA